MNQEIVIHTHEKENYYKVKNMGGKKCPTPKIKRDFKKIRRFKCIQRKNMFTLDRTRWIIKRHLFCIC